VRAIDGQRARRVGDQADLEVATGSAGAATGAAGAQAASSSASTTASNVKVRYSFMVLCLLVNMKELSNSQS
jgi:hypothetical protein